MAPSDEAGEAADMDRDGNGPAAAGVVVGVKRSEEVVEAAERGVETKVTVTVAVPAVSLAVGGAAAVGAEGLDGGALPR